MKTKLLFIILALFTLSFLTRDSFSEPRKMVLEFVTGTWCGYCPCGDDAAEQILTTYPQTIVIAYHGASSDPWQNFNGNAIRSMLGFSAYPTGIFDRTNHPGNGSSYPYITYNMWVSLASQRYNSSGTSNIGVIISAKNYNSTSRELSATMDATALTNLSGQYKVHFILLENNVVYPQNFYSSCGTAGYHNDYVHKWIVRNVINGAAGENINTGAWNMNQTISKSFTTVVDNAWVAENCDFVAVVYLDNPSGLFLSSVEQGSKQSVSGPLGVIQQNTVPSDYSLSQNYPNPFNPVTSIKYSIPKDGNASLKIYDMLGNEVATYFEGFTKAGSYNAEIDASNWASGVYFYRLNADGFSETKKMMLVK